MLVGSWPPSMLVAGQRVAIPLRQDLAPQHKTQDERSLLKHLSSLEKTRTIPSFIFLKKFCFILVSGIQYIV